MKRIEFIAPVEAIRGNLSGKQKNLVYAENDNPAYEAPIGRQYARNYRPSFIGAKRASDGLKYFSVKTKSATGLTLSSKKAMAVLGGAGALIAAILRDPSRKTALQLQLEYNIQHGLVETGTSLRKWMSEKVQNALRMKAQIIDFKAGAGTTEVKVKNPWVEGGIAPEVGVGEIVLSKFWGMLADQPIEYKLSGYSKKGIAHEGDTFGNDFFPSAYNVFGLTSASAVVGSEEKDVICFPFEGAVTEVQALAKNGTPVVLNDVIESGTYEIVSLPKAD